MVALGVHAVDARVAITIGDEDVAGGGVDSGVSWAVEHLAAFARDLFAGADGQEVFAGGGVFVDFVADVVDEPQVVFVVGGDSVCTHEPAVPELESVAVGVFGYADRALGIVVAPHVDEVSVGIED